MPKQINWDAIRADFVQGDYDYKQLAAKHDISHKSIELKASPKSENWQLLRQQYRENLVASLTPEQTTSIYPTQQKLTYSDINQIIDQALIRISSQVEQAEIRSLEKGIESLTKLIEVRTRLSPPTVEEWASRAIELGFNFGELMVEVKKVLTK